MTHPEFWIDLVLQRAMELRKAGVLVIGCEGNTVQLAPLEEQTVGAIDAPTDPDYVGDVFNDPASYADGVVPGFSITKFELED